MRQKADVYNRTFARSQPEPQGSTPNLNSHSILHFVGCLTSSSLARYQTATMVERLRRDWCHIPFTKIAL